MKITAIILTLNEEIHIARCLENIKDIADQIIVVDSYSNDATVEIAKNYQCTILQNVWKNHGYQFNWALERLSPDTDWVFRIDADEYLDPSLKLAIFELKNTNAKNISGAYFKRGIRFQGKRIRFGGVGSIRVLRLFKYGHGSSETRWMDEHIAINGAAIELPGVLVDDNLNTLSFWVDKHNRYANKEVFECLALKYRNKSERSCLSTVEIYSLQWRARVKRKIKNQLYQKMPAGIRAFAYFVYRYLFCLGFLDGPKGFAFHFLQGFWYRYLVDLKLQEAERYMRSKKVPYLIAVKNILHIEVEA